MAGRHKSCDVGRREMQDVPIDGVHDTVSRMSSEALLHSYHVNTAADTVALACFEKLPTDGSIMIALVARREIANKPSVEQSMLNMKDYATVHVITIAMSIRTNLPQVKRHRRGAGSGVPKPPHLRPQGP